MAITEFLDFEFQHIAFVMSLVMQVSQAKNIESAWTDMHFQTSDTLYVAIAMLLLYYKQDTAMVGLLHCMVIKVTRITSG